MRMSSHAAVGAACAAPVLFWSISGAMVLFLSSLLVDIDHFLFFCFHAKTLELFPRKAIENYKHWDYLGPRVLIFHNYETILLLAVLAMTVGGMALYLLGGVLLHFALDQVEGYVHFRYLRIRTLLGDIIRYRGYLAARVCGQENEYMITRRDSWWNHLRSNFPEQRLEEFRKRCRIMEMFPDTPVNSSEDAGVWQGIF